MTVTTETMFEAASRQKLRFDTPAGKLAVEDLWDLPLRSASKVNLDALAIDLNRQLKATEESFVSAPSVANAALTLRFEIVKHVIAVRVAENSAKLENDAKETKRRQIAEVIESKKAGALQDMSLEELEALHKSL